MLALLLLLLLFLLFLFFLLKGSRFRVLGLSCPDLWYIVCTNCGIFVYLSSRRGGLQWRVLESMGSLGGRGGASKLVLGISFVFFIIAFGLAIGAESQRSQATQTTDAAGYLICKYSATTATGLAVGALVCLLVAQLFITIVTRCLCCGVAYSPGAARTWAVVAFIFSWLVFILAFLILLVGATANEIHTRGYYNRNVTCQQVKKSLFIAGAFLTFITMVLSELYYILISKASSSAAPYGAPPPPIGLATYA